ncbi:MAG: hypothetical protein LBU43_01150 [Candidatus Accumulibacter sp.]|nr:hypothetical protein [Accumulibacter sp.]
MTSAVLSYPRVFYHYFDHHHKFRQGSLAFRRATPAKTRRHPGLWLRFGEKSPLAKAKICRNTQRQTIFVPCLCGSADPEKYDTWLTRAKMFPQDFHFFAANP